VKKSQFAAHLQPVPHHSPHAHPHLVPLDTEGSPVPQDKYDPADFFVAPSDGKGVSYRLTFRVPPDMEKSLDQIVASNRFPFGTRGDVLRWAVQEGIRKLESMEPVSSVTKRIDILSNLMNEDRAHSEFMSTFTQLEDQVNRYLAEQSQEQAIRVIALTKHHFEQMPDGYWRDRYLAELKKRFGSYLNSKPGIGIL
jgi:hypothetical protein